MPTNFETIIGLEVHAQLLTCSKMYCRCSADYSSTLPNTHVCPVCLGMPGVLPVINKKAVEFVMMTGLALHCDIAEHTKFDRKNYPYPDLMKGYQISQYDMPIALQGSLTIDLDGEPRKIGITRVHLEEDVAKLLHRAREGETYSLVDVNRSGVPLMEIVSEPDMRSPEEARQYLMKLRTILQYLGVSTGNMEEGSFRCDANISIRPEGSDKYLAKVEVKNMNSFKAVFRALEYEEKRQRQMATENKRIVQETRGWDDAKGVTVSQRSKESAHDYRYFPEPDLPPLCISREWVSGVRARQPELPEARRDRFMTSFGLPLYDANLLTASRATADYFEACLGAPDYGKLPTEKAAKDLSNWILGEVSRLINAAGCDINTFGAKVGPDKLTCLVLCAQGEINTATAKSVLEEMFQTGGEARNIIQKRGLAQISNIDEIKDIVRQIIGDNPRAVEDYKTGKGTALKFLVGQVMRATKGRANPALAGELLEKELAGDTTGRKE
jgi:aspartyl-tRNA(Asn)/glutamyl-tRNA(Gln) amidotransferase subunit B